jgi:hypothetical protein
MMSLSGKEILWLEWRNMTYFDLHGFSIQQWRRILSECEHGSNLGPRSLMWRICSRRSLKSKLQPYHLSLTHCTVIRFYCITYHWDWHSHGTVWSKPWLLFHPPSNPLSSFQTSLCVCDNVLNSTL